MKKTGIVKNVVVTGLLLCTGACGGEMLMSNGSGDYGNPVGSIDNPTAEFGATPGGVQDMRSARTLIELGRVPPKEAFSVQGMFSEHDLGLTGTTCAKTLCLRQGSAVAKTNDNQEALWVQVGMSSLVNPATFERKAQSIIFTVDVSGSMGWDYSRFSYEGEYPSPGALARRLLKRISEQLVAGDRVAVVAYGSEVTVKLAPQDRGDGMALTKAINTLDQAGSTNMEAGLRKAYELAVGELGKGLPVRVLLFTDEQPNVGATDSGSFQTIVKNGADQDVGMTVFGLGLGLNTELMTVMSQLKGGNAYSLATTNQVESLVAEDWPWFVTPLAWDLNVKLSVPEGYQVKAAYGFPLSGAVREVGLTASSVFVSKRKGALLVRAEPVQGGALAASVAAQVDLSYEDAISGGTIAESLQGGYDGAPLDAQGNWFEQDGVRKTVSLGLLVEGMYKAAGQYGSSSATALATLDNAIRRYDLAIGPLSANDKQALEQELDLARALRRLMQDGAVQATFYGE